LDKEFYKSLKTGKNFVLQQFKNKIIFNFVRKKILWLQKRYGNKFFFSPLSFVVAVFGSGIRDKHPGSATLLGSLLIQVCFSIDCINNKKICSAKTVSYLYPKWQRRTLAGWP
jgi:hypothetical protein